MTLQEQIEVVMENIDTPIANSGSLQIARQIIRKQSEMLKMAKEALSHYKAIETMSNMRGDCPISNEATKALATIEEMEKL